MTACALLVVVGAGRREDASSPPAVPAAPESVAIARPGTPVFARGVLVAQDLVLTCRHATHVKRWGPERHPAAALEVRRGDDVHPVVAYAWTSERYDFALLRLGHPLPPREAVQRFDVDRALPGERLRVLDPEATVAVLFPFEATASERDILIDAGGRYARSIEISYRGTIDGRFHLFSRRFAGQPVLAVRCTTTPGRSGSPLFDDGGRVAGILFAGDDPADDAEDGWLHHDAVLPTAVIRAELAGTTLGRAIGLRATGKRPVGAAS